MITVVGDRVERARERVSEAPHWGAYRRAVREKPDLVEWMYATIREVVRSKRYLNPQGQFPNSSWLGAEILRDWEHRVEWTSYLGQDPIASNALFGQIMWTVMFDDDREWFTTKTTPANQDREERVYWLGGS